MTRKKQMSVTRVIELFWQMRRCAFHEIIKKIEHIFEEIEELLDRCEHGKRHHAHHLIGKFTWRGISVEGEKLVITEPLVVGQSVLYSVRPVKADATDSTATLAPVQFTSSDETVFTVASDPANQPNGAIITSVGPGSATVNSTTTATEPDGTTTETITGADTVVVSAAPPPPPGPAVALVGTFGTPFPTPPPNPPTP